MTVGRSTLLIVCVLAAACGCAASGNPGTVSMDLHTPVEDVKFPATGALFGGPPDNLGDHYCTASVLDTPPGDVLITAAHCVATGDGTAARTGMSFVPGFHDHVRPFGTWTVTAAVVGPAWLATADPAQDVAFLVVRRDDGVPIENVTGGYQLAVNPADATPVTALGYPDTADTPLPRAGTTVRYSPTQLELDAHGLYEGTSGGPWLRDGDGEVVAVTGGHEEGGVDPDVSYGAYLDDSAAGWLQQAVTTPRPGPLT